MTENSEKILIGKIVNAVGIRGEVRVYNYGDEYTFDGLGHIYAEQKRKLTEYNIEKVRLDGNCAVVKLEGVDDRNAAEKLKEAQVYIYEEDLAELPDDMFYIRDMIGCAVIDRERGEIGTVTDVIQGLAQDNYEVELKETHAKILIPGVEAFVKEIDTENKVVKVDLIPGFIDEGLEA